MKLTTLMLVMLVFACNAASAHHNPVVYDGKTTVTITGTVKKARFGFPHSRYQIEVTNENGSQEQWTLMTEDPRDAKRLGFDDELKAIKVGDPITVVGWPNKIKAREIRGHQLHYPDGTVVMMRRGNYIWTADLRRIWRLRSGQDEFPSGFVHGSADDRNVGRVLSWIEEDDAVARIASEIRQERAALIGIDSGSGFEFFGVENEFECHTRNDGFRLEIESASLGTNERSALVDGQAYIEEYNDLLSRYWEYDVANCE